MKKLFIPLFLPLLILSFNDSDLKKYSILFEKRINSNISYIIGEKKINDSFNKLLICIKEINIINYFEDYSNNQYRPHFFENDNYILLQGEEYFIIFNKIQNRLYTLKLQNYSINKYTNSIVIINNTIIYTTLFTDHFLGFIDLETNKQIKIKDDIFENSPIYYKNGTFYIRNQNSKNIFYKLSINNYDKIDIKLNDKDLVNNSIPLINR